MSDVILCNISDAVKVVDEAREEWTRTVLISLGVPENILNFSDIREYRHDMDELGIEVELITDGDVNIYKKQWHNGVDESTSGWLPTTKDHLVAQWKTPTYVRKVDGKEVYYEIQLNEWSVTHMRRK